MKFNELDPGVRRGDGNFGSFEDTKGAEVAEDNVIFFCASTPSSPNTFMR